MCRFSTKAQSPPTEHRVALTDAVAARQEDLLAVLEMYWRGDSETAARHAADLPDPGMGDAAIATAQKRLTRLGHYNSAMLYYGGEWYWGVDRLQYLLERLDSAWRASWRDTLHPKLASIERAMQVSLPVSVHPGRPRSCRHSRFFVSLRSPYSVLALQRVFELADAFGLKLDIRLVFPMVMRGMQVPKAKLLYIVHDATREARKHGVPFGKFADPVGAGIERSLRRVYQLRAEIEHRERDFLTKRGGSYLGRGLSTLLPIRRYAQRSRAAPVCSGPRRRTQC